MSKSKAGLLIPAFCNILGILMIVAVIAATVPIVLPRAFGYEIFNVETGSMVPEIPIGSAVYVKEAEPQNIRQDEIISFAREEGAIITHRVVENHVVEGEFITKGDANPQEDIEAVPYDSLVGRVEYHFPILGSVFVLISSTIGKIYILLFAACGVMLNILAGRMRYSRRRKIKDAAREEARLQKRKEHEEEVRRKAEEEARRIRETYAIPEDPPSEGEEEGKAGDDAAAAADGVTAAAAGASAEEGSDSFDNYFYGEDSSSGSDTDAAAAVSSPDGSNDSGTDPGDGKDVPVKKKRKKHTARKVIMIILLIIFLGAGGLAGSVLLQYHNSDALYAEAAEQYSRTVSTRQNEENTSLIPGYLLPGWNPGRIEEEEETEAADAAGQDVQNPDSEPEVTEVQPQGETGEDNYINEDGLIVMRDDSQDQPIVWDIPEEEGWGNHRKAPLDLTAEEKEQFLKDLDPATVQAEKKYLRDSRILAPIQVDFDSLLEVNEDVKGWIYCEDTNINYPILHGQTNDTYLRHTYDGNYNIAGSIFIETDNDPEFKDYNTIVYGHHMNDGSMFAGLDQWADQEYYEKHPVMWILTPERDYMLVLVAGQHTSATSDLYTIFHEPDEEFQEYIQKVIENSDFKTDVEAPMDGHYAMLTTCAYIFDNARYVIHGLLIPADSAGGVPLW